MMSLRRKLIVIFGSLIVTILMIFSITSYLSSKAAYLAVMKNELGKVVEGMEHLAIYYDTITKTEESILKLKSTIRDIKIGKSGYPYIMNSEGDLILHPTLEGQNLINTKDVNGFEFIKDIIAKKDGETTYYWASKSDPSKIEEKIVSYTYYAPLDWYLVAGITVEEFLVPLDNVRNMLLLLAIIFLTVSIVIVFIVGNSISVPVMKIANEISGVTEQVSAASKEVAEASQRISQVTTEQASNIEETSSSLEEIAGMVNNNVENAERSSEMASEILNSSQKGYDSITKLIESMKEILESNENIQKLSDVIGEIADKLKVIDEIVFQTKLLSFNASVEAERAGEHGRGFAVVAQEVGNLAQMSGKAALEISSIVKDSVKKTEVITSTNKEKVDKGNVLVKHAAEILKEIKEKSQLMQGMAEEIVKASKEQSTGVAQINQAVSELDKSIQDNAANTEETAASGEELTGQAKMMTEIVTNLAMLVKGNSSKESFTKSIQKPSINRTREVKPILSQTRHERVAPASRESDKTISPKVETKRASVESRSTDDEWTKL